MDPAAAMTRHTLTCTFQSIKLQLQPHLTAADIQILALNTLATPVPPMLWKEVSSGQMLRYSRPLPRIRPPATPCGYLSLEAVTEHLGFSRRRTSQRLQLSRDDAREPLACDVLSSMSSAGGLRSSRLISAHLGIEVLPMRAWRRVAYESCNKRRDDSLCSIAKAEALFKISSRLCLSQDIIHLISILALMNPMEARIYNQCRCAGTAARVLACRNTGQGSLS